MTTYTDYQQRELDMQDIPREPNYRPDLVRERMAHVAAECRAWELVEMLQSAIAGDPHWRHEAQELLRLIDDGDVPEPRR